jgi:hypothetical protein
MVGFELDSIFVHAIITCCPPLLIMFLCTLVRWVDFVTLKINVQSTLLKDKSFKHEKLKFGSHYFGFQQQITTLKNEYFAINILHLWPFFTFLVIFISLCWFDVFNFEIGWLFFLEFFLCLLQWLHWFQWVILGLQKHIYYNINVVVNHELWIILHHSSLVFFFQK